MKSIPPNLDIDSQMAILVSLITNFASRTTKNIHKSNFNGRTIVIKILSRSAWPNQVKQKALFYAKQKFEFDLIVY
ncbi:hypothetical protein F8388_007404 [Cannabis sativa]|uniref:Uncharacterized protein n=1 Tax=Cannabis sativa TaxID=3483 RepID=A0A7J6F4E4_CANSA|nr:hypothetical protein F8388_007404 [Cannabis sativa]